MSDGNLLTDEAIVYLREKLARLEHEVYTLRQRASRRDRSTRDDILLAKSGAAIIDPETGDTAQSATVTIQKINPDTGAITAKTPAHTETAYNPFKLSIPASSYFLIVREFHQGAFIIVPILPLLLWRFTLNEAFSGGTAEGDILEMDGTDTGIDEDVADPLAIFSSDLGNGDAGLCLQQGASYYAIQAPCT